MNWSMPSEIGVTVPTIMVDLAPITSSPDVTQQDVAPGPVMTQADASPPEPVQAQVAPEQIAPTPPQEKPEVAAPPEQKLQPAEKPEPAKIVPDQKPAPVKPKAVRQDAKKPTEASPAPRTSAPTARRAPGAGGLGRERRRIGFGAGELQRARSRPSGALPPVSGKRQRPDRYGRDELYGEPRRSGRGKSSEQVVGRRGARCPGHRRWFVRPRRFRRSHRRSRMKIFWASASP